MPVLASDIIERLNTATRQATACLSWVPEDILRRLDIGSWAPDPHRFACYVLHIAFSAGDREEVGRWIALDRVQVLPARHLDMLVASHLDLALQEMVGVIRQRLRYWSDESTKE